MKIPYYPLQQINRCYEPALSQAVAEAVGSGWYLNGQHVRQFEEAFARYTQRTYCVSCANGLDALTLVLMAWKQIYGWDTDSEVIVPSFTFAATGLAVVRAGLKPVFCDVSDDAIIDINSAKGCVTSKTKAAIGVDLYGHSAQRVVNLRQDASQDLLVLIDAAQSHGMLDDTFADSGKCRAGAFGDAATFSFYPGKNLGALGDAGCVVTDDRHVADCCRTLANYGAPMKYVHEYAGLNSRMDELQATALSTKLPYLDAECERRRHIAAYYRQHIQHPLVALLPQPTAVREAHHIFPLFCTQREALQRHLQTCGIETLRHYPTPLHLQPAFRHFAHAECPVAERLAATELSIPIYPLLRDDEVAYVCECINNFNL